MLIDIQEWLMGKPCELPGYCCGPYPAPATTPGGILDGYDRRHAQLLAMCKTCARVRIFPRAVRGNPVSPDTQHDYECECGHGEEHHDDSRAGEACFMCWSLDTFTTCMKYRPTTRPAKGTT